MNKIIVFLFAVAMISVSIWMFRFQYFDREQDGRKYTTRQHIFTKEECYFVGEFERNELEKLGLIHCSLADN